MKTNYQRAAGQIWWLPARFDPEGQHKAGVDLRHADEYACFWQVDTTD